jgi:hypothetical protein
MAAISSNGTGGGNWGATATWTGGVVPNPDVDSVTIAAGDDVLFVNSDDTAGIDMSSNTGLAGLTLTGILRFSTGANRTSFLKIADNVDVTGTGALYVGNSDLDPIPLTSQATVSVNGTGQLEMKSVYLYGAHHVDDLAFTRLAADAASGTATLVLEDDMNLSNLDRIVVGCSDAAALSFGGVQTEANKGEYNVLSYNAGTKTVTLATNLNSNRFTGDYVAYIRRPVKIERRTGSSTALNAIPSPATFAGIHGVWFQGSPWTQSGTTPGLTKYDLDWVEYCTWATPNNQQATGPLRYCVGNNYTSNGIFSHYLQYKCIAFNTECLNARFATTNYMIGCVVQNTVRAIPNTSQEAHVYDCICINTQVGFSVSNYICGKIHNTYYSHGTHTATPDRYFNETESFDHNQVPGAYRAWTIGGDIIKQSTVQYDGQDTLKFTVDRQNYECFRDYRMHIKGGEQFTVSIYCQKDFSGVGVAGIQIIDPVRDPHTLYLGHTALASDTKADDVDTWEQLTASYTPANDMLIIVRLWAKAASGNVYFYTKPLEQMLPASASVLRRPMYVL